MGNCLNNSKSAAFIAVFFVAIMNISMAKSDQRVTIGLDQDYLPFAYIDDAGHPQGIYTDILLAAFSQLDGYKVELVGYPWKRLMKLVEMGEIFASYPPYYWPEKRPWMFPYSEPIITERVALYCNKNNVPLEALKGPLIWPNSFFGRTIGNDKGFETPGAAFFAAVNEGKITLHEDTALRNVKLLLLGRIDCYVNGEMSILYELKGFVSQAELRTQVAEVYKAMIIGENEGYVGYARKDQAYPFKADFVRRLDIIIKKMKSTGEIDLILDRYRIGGEASTAAPSH